MVLGHTILLLIPFYDFPKISNWNRKCFVKYLWTNVHVCNVLPPVVLCLGIYFIEIIVDPSMCITEFSVKEKKNEENISAPKTRNGYINYDLIIT